jgi:hypothetical protein
MLVPARDPHRPAHQNERRIRAQSLQQQLHLLVCSKCIFCLGGTQWYLEKRKTNNARPAPPRVSAISTSSLQGPRTTNKDKGKASLQPGYCKPAPSSLVSKLASLSKQQDEPKAEAVARSSGFGDAPQVSAAPSAYGQQRDESLALIEELPVGPIDHSPPVDDPNFDQIEPNSGIRLSCASPTSPSPYSYRLN